MGAGDRTETQSAPGGSSARDRGADGDPRFAAGAILGGRYQVVRFLARGGMGEVYEVADQTLGLRVALKVMRPTLAQDARVVRRFRREVELARQVTHENVCRIFDTGVTGDAGLELPFLTMEMLDGETLSTRLEREGRLDGDAAIPLAHAMAAGLGAAHRAGVIHRDFKPSNVMLVRSAEGSERVVVTDFGLAHREVSDDGATFTGAAIVGTPGYMSPEQVLGEPTGRPADIYAFGVVLYEMVTGQLPFRGETPMATAALRLRSDPRPPRELVASLSDAWQRAIVGCLRREPAARIESIDRVVATIDGARPTVRWRWAAIAGVVAVLGAGAAWIAMSARRADEPTPLLRHVPLVKGAPGRNLQTALSPDGRRVAIVDGALRVVGADGMTSRSIAIPDGAMTQYVSWFRDSTRILVSWIRDGRAELVELSADGGTARFVSEGGQGRVSPDGLHVAMLAGDDLMVARLDGSGARRVASVVGPPYRTIAWSQDGRALAILDGDGLRVVSADGTRTAPVSPPRRPISEAGVAWLEHGRLAIVALDAGSFDARLWVVPVDTRSLRVTGEPSSLGVFPLQAVTAIDSGDGRHLTAALRYTTTDVMVQSIPGRDGAPGAARSLTNGVIAETPLAFTTGGEVIVADRDGLGRIPREGGPRSPITPASVESLSVVEDAIAVIVRREGGHAFAEEIELDDGVTRSRLDLGAIGERSRVTLQCARTDGRACVLGVESPGELALRHVDRSAGAGATIATLALQGESRWALSPDGATIVVVHGLRRELRLVEVVSGAVRAISAPCVAQSVTWLDDEHPIVSCMNSVDTGYQLRVVEPQGAGWVIARSDDHWFTTPVVDRTGTWISYASVDVASQAFVLRWD